MAQPPALPSDCDELETQLDKINTECGALRADLDRQFIIFQLNKIRDAFPEYIQATTGMDLMTLQALKNVQNQVLQSLYNKLSSRYMTHELFEKFPHL